MRSPKLLVAVTSAFLALASAAHADTFASVGTLDAASRATLESSIAAARGRDAQTFSTVSDIIAHADELDHHKRGRGYPMASLLRGSVRGHAGATMALLEPLIAPTKFALPHSPSALLSLRAGLIEAAGDQRDPAAAPVYRAIISTSTEPGELRAAVEALGKLGIDADVAMLSRLALTAGPTQDAIVTGIGTCRRASAAHALETLASQHPTGMLAKHLLRSLGTIGSAWALALPHAAPAGEVATIRDTAARAALAMFVSSTEPDVQMDASNALIVIAAPDTPQWIASAKSSAQPGTVVALDALQTRFANNPATIRRTP
jgi:hypothetical protein